MRVCGGIFIFGVALASAAVLHRQKSSMFNFVFVFPGEILAETVCFDKFCFVLFCFGLPCFVFLSGLLYFALFFLCFALFWFMVFCFALFWFAFVCFDVLCSAPICFALLSFAPLCFAICFVFPAPPISLVRTYAGTDWVNPCWRFVLLFCFVLFWCVFGLFCFVLLCFVCFAR